MGHDTWDGGPGGDGGRDSNGDEEDGIDIL
jgi:hypothetical protein